MTFYNGETTEVGPGTAIRIPVNTFDRLVTELQMPEHQRRRMKLAAKTRTPEYNGKSPPTDSTWQRKFAPPKTSKAEIKDDNLEKFRVQTGAFSQVEYNVLQKLINNPGKIRQGSRVSFT